MASVSQTFTSSCVRQGTSMDGASSRISARMAGSSGEMTTSSKGSLTSRAISQPRKDQDE